jgi:glycosyltransferase involved in cell wall biosynthesis
LKTILLLIKGLGRGGAEQILVSSARQGDRSKFRYEVGYLLPWKDAFVPELTASGIPVHCLQGAHEGRWLLRLRSTIAARRVDLVHVHSPVPAIGARLSLARSMPIVYTEHNVWQRYHWATRWGNLLTYPRNAHVFAVSDNVRSSIRYPSGLRFREMPAVETLYHGPDHQALPLDAEDGVRQELGIPLGAPVIGTVANLKPHKGLSYLLRAATMVRDSLPGARFVIVGQGPLERELRATARDLDLDEAVIFTGFRDDVGRIVSIFDLFVLPSLHEGLSLALIEAMFLGKPAVVTSVGGLPEVVRDGEEGFLVPPADPVALARQIISLLSDPTLLESFGLQARRRAEVFQIGSAIERIENVYGELLA